MPVQAEIPWHLNPRGPERQPKTIYLRFGEKPATYQDDIVLDRRRPGVRVTFIPVGDGASRLLVAAHDTNSGVTSMQLMREGKSRGWRRFDRSITMRGVS